MTNPFSGLNNYAELTLIEGILKIFKDKNLFFSSLSLTSTRNQNNGVDRSTRKSRTVQHAPVLPPRRFLSPFPDPGPPFSFLFTILGLGVSLCNKSSVLLVCPFRNPERRATVDEFSFFGTRGVY
jgi:hypothetical protein